MNRLDSVTGLLAAASGAAWLVPAFAAWLDRGSLGVRDSGTLMQFHRPIIGIVCLVGWSLLAGEPAPALRGNFSIRGATSSSEIVITTTDRLAGAIHSLTWNGKEFIDSHDHGRQLQSAASFNCASAQEFWAERFNPTEAGSRGDGSGQKSSSKLLRIRADGAELATSTQMAFWLCVRNKSPD